MDPIWPMRAVYGENMYIVYFQKPGVADAALAKDVGKSFRFFMRKGGPTAEEYAKLPQAERNLELVKAIESDESQWPGELLMPRTSCRSSSTPSRAPASPAASTGIAISPATGS